MIRIKRTVPAVNLRAAVTLPCVRGTLCIDLGHVFITNLLSCSVHSKSALFSSFIIKVCFLMIGCSVVVQRDKARKRGELDRAFSNVA